MKIPGLGSESVHRKVGIGPAEVPTTTAASEDSSRRVEEQSQVIPKFVGIATDPDASLNERVGAIHYLVNSFKYMSLMVRERYGRVLNDVIIKLMTEDPNPEIRNAAADAIAQYNTYHTPYAHHIQTCGKKDIIRTLLTAFDDDQEVVRKTARTAFHWHESENWSALIEILRSDQDPTIRRHAAEIFLSTSQNQYFDIGYGRSGTSKVELNSVLHALKRAARQDPDASVRMAAKASLDYIKRHRADGAQARRIATFNNLGERLPSIIWGDYHSLGISLALNGGQGPDRRAAQFNARSTAGIYGGANFPIRFARYLVGANFVYDYQGSDPGARGLLRSNRHAIGMQPSLIASYPQLSIPLLWRVSSSSSAADLTFTAGLEACLAIPGYNGIGSVCAGSSDLLSYKERKKLDPNAKPSWGVGAKLGW